ncbi:TIGR01777 family oxidoreductase, partial [Planctomycetota bacterium]
IGAVEFLGAGDRNGNEIAGESIASGRWTAAKMARIRDSRVTGTRKVAESLAALQHKPTVLVCASAIGYYGDRGDEQLHETAAGGNGFLADLCRDWEEATGPAVGAGIRVVNLRIGVVISRDGGALPQVLTPFKLGLGGRVGSGDQYWSWVSIADVVGAIQHSIDTPSLCGPVNCVSPNPVTNAEFTKTLGQVLNRPTVFPLPAFAARLVLGKMANDLLLASARVLPNRLIETNYKFHYSDLVDALRHEIVSPR